MVNRPHCAQRAMNGSRSTKWTLAGFIVDRDLVLGVVHEGVLGLVRGQQSLHVRVGG